MGDRERVVVCLPLSVPVLTRVLRALAGEFPSAEWVEDERGFALEVDPGAVGVDDVMVEHPYWGPVYLVRSLLDGREVVVLPLLFGKAQLGVGRRTGGWEGSWSYESVSGAVRAAVAWDGVGEPVGWFRHPASGRRRPGGDPEREFVRP